MNTEPERQESRSSALKTRFIAWNKKKIMSHEMSSLDRPMASSNKPQNIPHSWHHRPKTPNPEVDIFLKFESKRQHFTSL